MNVCSGFCVDRPSCCGARERRPGRSLLGSLSLGLLCLLGLLSLPGCSHRSALGQDSSSSGWFHSAAPLPLPRFCLGASVGRSPRQPVRGRLLTAEFSPWRPRGLAPGSLAWNAPCAGTLRPCPSWGCLSASPLLSPTSARHSEPAGLPATPVRSHQGARPRILYTTLPFCWLASRALPPFLPPSPAPGQGDLLAALVSLPAVCGRFRPGLH